MDLTKTEHNKSRVFVQENRDTNQLEIKLVVNGTLTSGPVHEYNILSLVRDCMIMYR